MLALAAVLGLVPIMTDAAPLPGSLDLSFGDDGVVLTYFDPPFGGAVIGLVLLADGRILAVGTYSDGGGPEPVSIGLARYFSDGSLDPSFGDAGLSTVEANDVFPGRQFFTEAAILLSDGRIVVQGNLYTAVGTLIAPALVRFNDNGTLDTTFGRGGIVETGLPGGHLVDLNIDGEGRWVGTGSFGFSILTVRFMANGDLDTGFGSGGTVTTDFSANPDQGMALLLRPDGRIIVTGSVNQDGSDWDFAALRLLENGVLDTTFGDGGLRTVAFGPGSFDISKESTVGPDGKILIGGLSTNKHSLGGLGIARLLENGDLDTSFGQSGTVEMNFLQNGDSQIDAGIAVDATGRIVCGGTAGRFENGAYVGRFLLAAWTAEGELDTSFGNGGSVLTNPVETSRAFAMAVQTDDKILLGGISGETWVSTPASCVRDREVSRLVVADFLGRLRKRRYFSLESVS